MSSTKLITGFLCLCFLNCAAGLSQTLNPPQELKNSLEKHAFVLRHNYTDPKLMFDSSGQIIAGEKEGFGPSDGTVYVLQTQLLPDNLVLNGKRPVYLYVPKTQNWQMTNLGKPVSVEIHLPGGESATAAISRLMDNVFLKSSEAAALECSNEEQRQLIDDIVNHDRKDKQDELPPMGDLKELQRYCLPGGDRAYKVGRGINMPHVRHAPDPEYSADARRARIEGKSTLIAIVVNTSGSTSAISIMKPLGENFDQNLGIIAFELDQKAVEAVSKWQFDPAVFKGTPVPVIIKIEVNFRLR